MIKRIIIIIAVSMLALACKSNTGSSGKPVTKNIPSVNHTKKQGSLNLNASKTALFSIAAQSTKLLLLLREIRMRLRLSRLRKILRQTIVNPKVKKHIPC